MNYHRHLIRFGFTALLIAILLCAVDLEELKAEILSVSLPAVLTAAAGYALTQVITAAKWHVLLQAAGSRVSIEKTIRAVFIGMYVNAFCFGTIGGDLIRAMFVGNGNLRKGVSVATVIADRALGLGVLATIGILSGLIFGSLQQQPLIAIVAGFVILAAIIGWSFAPTLMVYASHRMPRFADAMTALGSAFPHEPRVLIKAISLALIYHLLQITVIGILIAEIGGRVPWSYLFFAVPFINIAGTLPLSWMGLGIRETGYVLFFSPAYLTRESAMTVGMIWLLGMTIVSAAGGVIAALSGEYKAVKNATEAVD